MNVCLASKNMCIFKSLIVYNPKKTWSLRFSLKPAFMVYLNFFKKIITSLALKLQSQKQNKTKKKREPLFQEQGTRLDAARRSKKGQKKRGREHPAWVKGRTETRWSGWLKNRHILATDSLLLSYHIYKMYRTYRRFNVDVINSSVTFSPPQWEKPDALQCSVINNVYDNKKSTAKRGDSYVDLHHNGQFYCAYPEDVNKCIKVFFQWRSLHWQW